MPPSLPQASLSVQSFSKDIRLSSDAEKRVPSQPIQTGYYRRMQPPIIRLTGHVGFVVIPSVEQYFIRIEALEGGMPQCMIIDLTSVRHLETCAARLVAKLVSRMAAHSTPGLLAIVKPDDSPQVLLSLLRGGLDFRQTGEGSTSEPHIEPSMLSGPFFCKDLVQAIRICQNGSRDAASASPVVLRPLGLPNERPLTDEVERFVDEITYSLPRTHSLSEAAPDLALSSHERIKRAGLTIRQIRPGEAISCSRYPVQHVFMVLRGRVRLETPHKDHSHVAPLEPIRVAVRKAIQTAFCSLELRLKDLFVAKHRPAQASVMTEYLKEFDWFDASRSASHCAHGCDDPCWILDIDPDNEVGVATAEQVAQRSTSTKQ